jgi:hypothetical protein
VTDGDVMTAGIWFWILYVISIVVSGGWYWRNQAILAPFGPFSLLFFILIGLLGWGVFGAPIR